MIKSSLHPNSALTLVTPAVSVGLYLPTNQETGGGSQRDLAHCTITEVAPNVQRCVVVVLVLGLDVVIHHSSNDQTIMTTMMMMMMMTMTMTLMITIIIITVTWSWKSCWNNVVQVGRMGYVPAHGGNGNSRSVSCSKPSPLCRKRPREGALNKWLTKSASGALHTALYK